MSLPNYQLPVVDSPVDYSRLHTAEWIQARIEELQKLRPDPLIALAPGAPKDQERLYRGIARELCALRDELELVKRLGVGAKWRPIDALPRTTPLNARVRKYRGLTAEQLADRMRALLRKAEATKDPRLAQRYRYQASTYRWKAEQRARQLGQPIPDMPKEAAA